jgi:hypothetical protein
VTPGTAPNCTGCHLQGLRARHLVLL